MYVEQGKKAVFGRDLQDFHRFSSFSLQCSSVLISV